MVRIPWLPSPFFLHRGELPSTGAVEWCNSGKPVAMPYLESTVNQLLALVHRIWFDCTGKQYSFIGVFIFVGTDEYI
jgi:hypothetical protein